MPRRSLLLAFAALVLAGLGVLLLVSTRGARPAAARREAAEVAAPAPGAPTARAAAPAGAPVAAEPEPTAEEEMAALSEDDPQVPKYVTDLPPGDGTGVHAFPPPGTKPIKGGIIVPEGYELPPGYLRHVQYTDEGDELPAVLMFHPDYHPLDASGKPVPLPADRLVPPEMAPPGMPIRVLPPVPVRADLDEHNQPIR